MAERNFRVEIYAIQLPCEVISFWKRHKKKVTASAYFASTVNGYLSLNYPGAQMLHRLLKSFSIRPLAAPQHPHNIESIPHNPASDGRPHIYCTCSSEVFFFPFFYQMKALLFIRTFFYRPTAWHCWGSYFRNEKGYRYTLLKCDNWCDDLIYPTTILCKSSRHVWGKSWEVRMLSKQTCFVLIKVLT